MNDPRWKIRSENGQFYNLSMIAFWKSHLAKRKYFSRLDRITILAKANLRKGFDEQISENEIWKWKFTIVNKYK